MTGILIELVFLYVALSRQIDLILFLIAADMVVCGVLSYFYDDEEEFLE